MFRPWRCFGSGDRLEIMWWFSLFSSYQLSKLSSLSGHYSSEARHGNHQPEKEGGEANWVDRPLGHIVQHGCCSPEEDREVRGQEGLWMQETERISHSSAMAWKSTRSAVWRTTAASWPSLAPTPSGMQDTPRTGTETVSWHPEEQLINSHQYMYSHILILYILTYQDWCSAIVWGIQEVYFCLRQPDLRHLSRLSKKSNIRFQR